MSPRSAHTSPVLVTATGVQPLARLELGGPGHDGKERELFIEQLVHDHPEVIPMIDIEPAFTPLVSMCRQLVTPAGDVDNFWMTPDGGLVIGECKLVRNPQARREVIAQALEYAGAISSWDYRELEDAVAKASRRGGTLWERATAGQHPLDRTPEEVFVNSVTRRLKSAQIMVLIIGDGIHESASRLASFLQLHAGLRIGLALVDLSIWQMADGTKLVVPRVPMVTETIVRAVVHLENTAADAGVTVSSPQPARSSTVLPGPASLSEEVFYQQLDAKNPGLTARLKPFLDDLESMGATLEPKAASCAILWGPLQLANIEVTGSVWLQKTLGEAQRLGVGEAGVSYITALANAIGMDPRAVTDDKKAIRLSALLAVSDVWRKAVMELARTVDDPGLS